VYAGEPGSVRGLHLVVEDITEKSGRSGRFVLVTWLASYRNAGGELVAEARSSMIARP